MPWQTNLENISALAADRCRLQQSKTKQPLADATMRSKLHTTSKALNGVEFLYPLLEVASMRLLGG